MSQGESSAGLRPQGDSLIGYSCSEIAEIISTPAEKFGVIVESVLIRGQFLSKESMLASICLTAYCFVHCLADIVFSQSLQESLSSAAQAKRVGESKIIAARAEVDGQCLPRLLLLMHR